MQPPEITAMHPPECPAAKSTRVTPPAPALRLDPDRLLPVDPAGRGIARALYARVRELPIVSPHGHTDPAWFATNRPVPNATELLLVPDHYVLRMLYSQGIPLEALGVPPRDGREPVAPRDAWGLFASHYHLFRGTPSRLWMDQVFAEVFGLDERLCAGTADAYFDHINAQLATEAFLPRSILERFRVEFLATTEGALDALTHHATLIAEGWGRRVVTTFRPDDVLDPDRADFARNLGRLGELTGEDTTRWSSYLDALRARRLFFRRHGATATDHGHPTPRTADLAPADCQRLLDRCLAGHADAQERELFRAQMLTEMAGMSLEDGMVMQLHPGVHRNHNRALFESFGRDMGADIPVPVSYVEALRPLLDRHGNDPRLRLILFTLDESTYARELAPLAGHYPCLRLGPPWWFHDSPEGMLRYRRQVTETAGFYNTAGFNDDTRALLSIPARHDVARRMDCRFLADLVTEGRLAEDEAFDLIEELSVNLVRQSYRLSGAAAAER